MPYLLCYRSITWNTNILSYWVQTLKNNLICYSVNITIFSIIGSDNSHRLHFNPSFLTVWSILYAQIILYASENEQIVSYKNIILKLLNPMCWFDSHSFLLVSTCLWTESYIFISNNSALKVSKVWSMDHLDKFLWL